MKKLFITHGICKGKKTSAKGDLLVNFAHSIIIKLSKG